MSTTDTNRAVAQQFYDEVVSQGTFEVLDEITAENAHDGATRPGTACSVDAPISWRGHAQ